MYKKALIAFILLALFPTSLWAKVPKVLLIPIENIDNNSSVSYLKDSLTESISEKLDENFAYSKLSFSQAEDIAEDNGFLYEDEFYTRSVGLQLGMLMQADIVISGGFKNNQKTNGLRIDIYAQDVKKQKVLNQVSKDLTINSNMFSQVDATVALVIEEMRNVLPGKGNFTRTYYDDRDFSDTRLLLSGGLDYVELSAPQSKWQNGNLSFQPSDFPNSIHVQAEYQRHNDFWSNTFLYGKVGLNFGSTSQELVADDIDSELFAFKGTAGGGYQWFYYSRFYLSPFLGFGYYTGTVTSDLAIPGKTVVDTSNENILDEVEFSTFGPVVELGFALGVEMNSRVSVELSQNYLGFFDEDGLSNSLAVNLGVAFGL